VQSFLAAVLAAGWQFRFVPWLGSECLQCLRRFPCLLHDVSSSRGTAYKSLHAIGWKAGVAVVFFVSLYRGVRCRRRSGLTLVRVRAFFMHFPHLLYEVSSSGGPWAGDVRKRMGGRRGCRFRISLFRIVVLPWRAVQAAERAGFGPSVCILRSLSSSAAWSIQQSGNQARMKQASGWEAGAAAIVAHRFFVSLNRGGAGWLLSKCVHSSVAFLVCCMKYPAVGEPGENKACKRMGSRRAISLIAFSFHTVAELAWVRLRAYFRRFPRLLYEVSSSRGTGSWMCQQEDERLDCHFRTAPCAFLSYHVVAELVGFGPCACNLPSLSPFAV